MKYIVRVKHSSTSVEPKFDEFEKDTRDADELDALHDEAVTAYVSAVQSYDSGHTVSLFRAHNADDKGTGAVTVHESLGTGTGVLADEQDTEENTDTNPDDSTPVIAAAVEDDAVVSGADEK